MAEFDSIDALVIGARRAREAGYRKVDAYTPYPSEELNEALDLHHSKLPLIVLIAGTVGLLVGYGLQYYTSAISYPLNIGGRPLNSWPSFIPVTFETTILFAGIAAVVGMLALNGLPQLYHPVFNNPRFAMASRSRFFLVIEATDPQYGGKTPDFLKGIGGTEVTEVAQ
jgi:hypothetical protein